MLTKTDAKNLQRDFVPKGERVDIKGLKFRQTEEHEIYQCHYPSSYDIQSGPIYCGRVADFCHIKDEHIIPLCSHHAKVLRNHKLIILEEK